MRQTLGDIIDRLFGGSPESLVLGLVETEQLDPERLAALTRLINKSRKEGGDAGK